MNLRLFVDQTQLNWALKRERLRTTILDGLVGSPVTTATVSYTQCQMWIKRVLFASQWKLQLSPTLNAKCESKVLFENQCSRWLSGLTGENCNRLSRTLNSKCESKVLQIRKYRLHQCKISYLSSFIYIRMNQYII